MANNDVKLPLRHLKSSTRPAPLLAGTGYEHTEVAIPKLDGNPLALLNALIKLSIISIEENDHSFFQLLGSDKISDLSISNIENLEKLIKRIQLKKDRIFQSVVLLGNVFSNTEYNEYVMLILLQHLHELGLDFHLLMDIKDYSFLHLLEEISCQPESAIEDVKYELQKKEVTSNLMHSTIQMINGIVQDKITIPKLASAYRAIKDHCQLLHASKKQNGNLIIYCPNRFVSSALASFKNYFPELGHFPLDLNSIDSIYQFIKSIKEITVKQPMEKLFHALKSETAKILENRSDSKTLEASILTQLAMGILKIPPTEARFHLVYNEEKLLATLAPQLHPLLQRGIETKAYLCYHQAEPSLRRTYPLDHSVIACSTSTQSSPPAKLIRETALLTSLPLPRAVNKTDKGQIQLYCLGDLHGNTLKLLHFLCREGLVYLLPKVYQQIAKDYLEANDGDIAQHYTEFKKNVDTLKLCRDPNDYLIYLIGDIFTDRGRADPYTMYILRKLSDKGVNFKITFSNHDSELLYQHYHARSAESLQNKMESNSLSAYYRMSTFLHPDQSCSGQLTARLLEIGALNHVQIKHFFDEVYYPRLELFDIKETQEGILLLVHAPAGFELLQGLAIQLGLPFVSTNRETLVASIENIKNRARDYLTEKNIHLFFQWIIGRNAENPDPLKEPFLYALWNRSDKHIHFRNKPNETSILVIHGHNGEISYGHLPELINIDSYFGKVPSEDTKTQAGYLTATLTIENNPLTAAASSASLLSSRALERSFSSVFSEQDTPQYPRFFSTAADQASYSENQDFPTQGAPST